MHRLFGFTLTLLVILNFTTIVATQIMPLSRYIENIHKLSQEENNSPRAITNVGFSEKDKNQILKNLLPEVDVVESIKPKAKSSKRGFSFWVMLSPMFNENQKHKEMILDGRDEKLMEELLKEKEEISQLLGDRYNDIVTDPTDSESLDKLVNKLRLRWG